AIGAFFAFSGSRALVSRVSLVLLCFLGVLPFYALLTPEFAWHSAGLWLLTYGTFIFLIVVPVRHTRPKLYSSVMAVARWVLLIEGSWGLAQGVLAALRAGTFDGAVGDAVAGTIRPFAI